MSTANTGIATRGAARKASKPRKDMQRAKKLSPSLPIPSVALQGASTTQKHDKKTPKSSSSCNALCADHGHQERQEHSPKTLKARQILDKLRAANHETPRRKIKKALRLPPAAIETQLAQPEKDTPTTPGITDAALQKSEKLLEEMISLGLDDEDCDTILPSEDSSDHPTSEEDVSAFSWPQIPESGTLQIPVQFIKTLEDMWQYIQDKEDAIKKSKSQPSLACGGLSSPKCWTSLEDANVSGLTITSPRSVISPASTAAPSSCLSSSRRSVSPPTTAICSPSVPLRSPRSSPIVSPATSLRDRQPQINELRTALNSSLPQHARQVSVPLGAVAPADCQTSHARRMGWETTVSRSTVVITQVRHTLKAY